MPAELGEEQIANTLVTKWRVDEDSVAEAHRAVQTGEERLMQIKDEMETLHSSKFKAFQDMRLEAQQLHFNQVESIIRVHWNERLALVEGNAEAELRIHEQLHSDIAHLEQQRKMARESDEQEEKNKPGAAATGGKGLGMGGILSSVGWGGIMGMGSMAGLMAVMAESTAALRSSQTEARDIGEAAGRDPAFAYGLSPTFQRLGRRLQMDQGTLGRVAGELVPIAGGGEAGGQQIGELTEFAVEAGQARGIDPQVITRLMTQFRILEGTSMEGLKNKIADVVQKASEIDMPAGMFVQTLNSLVERGRMFNVSMDESTNLIRFFGREIQEGTITVQQMSALQQAGAAAPMGIQAMVSERLQAQGGPLAERLKSLGADDPYFGAKAVQGILRGSLVTSSGFVTPQEGSGEEKLLREQQQQLRDIMMDLVKDMGQQTAGGGGAFQEQMMIRHFMDMIGVTSPDMNPGAAQAAIRAAFGEGTISKGALRGGGGGALTADELAAEGRKSIEESISMLQKFKTAVGEVADSLNLQRQWIAAIARGDMVEARRIEGKLGQMSGENTAGGQFAETLGVAAGAGLPGGLGTLFTGISAAKIGQGIAIYINPKAAEHIELEAHEENTQGNAHLSPRNLP